MTATVSALTPFEPAYYGMQTHVHTHARRSMHTHIHTHKHVHVQRDGAVSHVSCTRDLVRSASKIAQPHYCTVRLLQ